MTSRYDDDTYIHLDVRVSHYLNSGFRDSSDQALGSGRIPSGLPWPGGAPDASALAVGAGLRPAGTSAFGALLFSVLGITYWCACAAPSDCWDS